MNNQLKSHYHCVYKLTYHLVLVTKYRRKCFTSAMLDMHPNIMPSKFINNLKTVTSRLMRKEFAKHLAHFYCKPVLWTRAYCLLTTGGATIDTIRQYIEKQERLD